MKKPYQIEALRAMKGLEEMAADGNPAVQMVLPMAEMVGWLSGRKWETCWYRETCDLGRKYDPASMQLCGVGLTTSAKAIVIPPIGPSIITSISASEYSCGAATKCPRWARPSTRTESCTGNLAYFVFSCEAVHKLMVKSVGKPDARNGHVRFDERGRETTG